MTIKKIDPLRTKRSILLQFMREEKWIDALRLAKSFGELGTHKETITRAWNAHYNPQFYRDIGLDPDALIAAGIAALKERYDN